MCMKEGKIRWISHNLGWLGDSRQMKIEKAKSFKNYHKESKHKWEIPLYLLWIPNSSISWWLVVEKVILILKYW